MTARDHGPNEIAHPNPIDRNRSITWARYCMDSDDWVLLALKVTRRGRADAEPSLVTAAIMNHAGETILEAMVKAPDIVPSEEIAQHGVDYAVVYNAKPYDAFVIELLKSINGRDVIVWNAPVVKQDFAELDDFFNVPRTSWKFHSAAFEYARFVGVTADVRKGYDEQPLPVKGISALDECRAARKLIEEMAASSQTVDPVVGGKPGWTAEFYRPKLNARDKIKGMFGFHADR